MKFPISFVHAFYIIFMKEIYLRIETGRNPTGNLVWELHRSNLIVDFVKLSLL